MTAKEFEKEFKSLYLPLGMYALRIVDDAEAAQDCVQNAFLKVWEGLCDGTEVDCFQAYMYRAVRNQCLSHLRSLRETADIVDIAEPTEEDVDTSERDAALWHAIDRLPDRCRQVFLLSKRDGLSQEQIAAEMGISLKTVKNQMTKAYDRLRAALADGRMAHASLHTVLLFF
ncbi:MAG: RNA polymerase sigma factor [Lepagella sp.]